MRRPTHVGSVVVAATALLVAGCDWAQVGHGPGRTSYNPVETVLTPETVNGIEQAWVLGDPINPPLSAPVAANGRGFVTLGGDVVSFDLATRAVVWRHELYSPGDVWPFGPPGAGVRHAWMGDPAVVGGRVYVPYGQADPTCGDTGCTWEVIGGVATLNAADGAPVTDTPWQSGGPSESVLIGPHGGYVVATTADFDGTNFARGSEVVVHRTDAAPWTLASDVPPALDEPREHLVTAVGTRVRAHELGCTGGRCVRAWSHDVGSVVAGVATDARAVYVTTTAGAVVVLDAVTGEERWSAATPGPVSSAPAVAAGVVYVAGGDTLSAIPACGVQTCEPVWTAQVSGTLSTQPVVAGGLVYVSERTSFEPYPYPHPHPLPGTRGLVYATAGCGAPTCEPLVSTPVSRGEPAESAVADGTYLLGGEAYIQGLRLP